MTKVYEGEIFFQKDELDLHLTLLGGQSFRWKKVESAVNGDMWLGVAYECFWILTQTGDTLKFKVYCSHQENISSFEDLLKKYFNMDFDLSSNLKKWCGNHKHFKETYQTIKAVRMLQQDPLENVISFICSQNNNIKRISSMIEWLCANYGQKICTFDGNPYYSFPTLDSLLQNQRMLEQSLRNAKFGYRAKFISLAIKKIGEFGGMKWFNKLRCMTFNEARLELTSLPGIGFKVADCICLMSLNHLNAVPVDTHIFQIAQKFYMPHLKSYKSITPKIYEEIANHFRLVYGVYAGWAQTVLFCSDLKMFQKIKSKNIKDPAKNKKVLK